MAPGILARDSTVAVEKATSLAELTEDWDDTIRFYLNGTKVAVDTVNPEVTLLEYLRGIGLTGTKLGCAEGGCGACTVVSTLTTQKERLFGGWTDPRLRPIGGLPRQPHDKEDIPRLGECLYRAAGQHRREARYYGGRNRRCEESSCGSAADRHRKWEPVWVLHARNCHGMRLQFPRARSSTIAPNTNALKSLYALLRNDPSPSEHAVEEAFDGNLCRCTGYRPILDAAQSFNSRNACGKSSSNGGSGCCMEKNGSGGCCKDSSTSNGKEESVELKFPTPDFKPYSPDTELIFPSALRKHEFRPLMFGNKRKKWYRPVTVDQLLRIKNVHPDAKLIGGSTETQIEIKFKAMRYAASVYVGDIPELRQFTFHDDYLEIGANVSLTDLEHICEQAAQVYGPARSQPFEAIKKQLRYFAGRQIRNVASPAGNLATASPISDLNPVFVATNTVLVAKSLSEEKEIPMTEFFQGYRKTALPQNAIISSLRIPAARETGEHIRAYKQAKRKDDDIAIVNSALRVSLSETHDVTSANLVFGGMAAMTVSAKNAEAFLVGKKFTNPATLEGVMSALEKDFNLPFGVPGGMATYRKSLALGFFYRFYYDVLSGLEVKASDLDPDVVAEIERAISSGEKDNEASVAYQQKILGKATPHVSALKQATGEAQYTDDIPVQQNELFGCMVLSTKAHAKILSVDASAALDIPGVIDYVDHKDLPNPQANWWGAPKSDEQFFAVDEVHTAGQPIGVILANTAKLAEEGMRAVKVEYEDLPAIFTIEEAIEAESYFEHYRYIKCGDTEDAFKHSDHIFEGVSRIGGQEHFYLETQACLAIWKPEDGEMEVWSGTQNPTET